MRVNRRTAETLIHSGVDHHDGYELSVMELAMIASHLAGDRNSVKRRR